nr:methionyl-tRNA formyltransferase [Actinomycetales bacterium]
MRVIFAGTPTPAIASLEALAASGHEVVAVLTRPEAPRGRGRSLHPSEVAVAAERLGLPVLTPRSLRDPDVQRAVADLGADAAAVVAYGQLVPAALLALFPWVNLHFSLLPRWRGAAPVQRAIAAGDHVTGACAFLLEEGLDTGPVLARMERPIGANETAGEVLEDLSTAGAPVLVAALDALADGTARPKPQPQEGVTLAPKVTVDEAGVDWALGATEIALRIRAFTPAPGAWARLRDGMRVKLRSVTAGGPAGLEPGELRVAKNEVHVGTGEGAIRLGDVAPAGRSWMDAAAWGRGLRGEVRFAVGEGQ